MARRRTTRRSGYVAILCAMFGMAAAVSAQAQPPSSSPNQMCGTGETFTVNLPGTPLGIDDTDGFFRNIDVPAVARPDSVTLPKGCRIYAFLISGYGDNEDYDRIIFYKVAEFVARNNGYVHVGWWNNLTSEYMARPLHLDPITVQKIVPILGIPIGEPIVIHPTPKTTGIPDTFLNTNLDLPKANPDEDFQFLSDARLVLKAVRQHNPTALIIVAGHSMGGNAVARLASSYPDVPIDLLAPIDPVGNRDMPRGELGQKNFNWTRWRAAVNFRGYKQWDCVRNALNLCADTDPSLFGVAFTCTVANSPWLPVKPIIGTKAPLVCNKPVYADPGTRLTIGSNVRYLYHRWQHESVWPVDFPGTERFTRTVVPLSTTNILSGNYQAPVLAQLNPLLPNDPDKTCYAGTDPRDASFQCNPTDGHGEIIGVRVEGLSTRVRPGLELTNWPPRSSTFNPGDRRDRLVQLAVDGPAWPYRPQNPDLCLVCDDIIAITERLMAQQPQETEEDGVPPASHAAQEPDANAAGWANEDVVVSIGATDDRSGVQQISVLLAGAQVGHTITPGSSAEATISAEGLTTVSYFASDLAGNAEAAHTLDVRIDKTPPEVFAITDIPINSEGWIGAPVVVSFVAADNPDGSGLAASSPEVTVSTEGAGQEVSGAAEDTAGNSALATVTLNIDLTPPGITLHSHGPAPNAAGWNNSDVTLTWNCSDALSGPAAGHVARLVSSEGAAQNVNAHCVDLADNSAGDARSVNLDKTGPTTQITTPPDGAVYLVNAVAHAAYGCTDALSGIDSCVGSVSSGAALDTAAVGSRVFTVNAADVAGNQSTTSHSYAVHYVFSGFMNPIAPVPAVNRVKAGRTVPIKYSLRDANGGIVSDLGSFVSLLSAPVTCNGNVATAEAEEVDGAGSTTIRFDTDKFIFNWKTSSAWDGSCRALELNLSDGTRRTVTFEFK